MPANLKSNHSSTVLRQGIHDQPAPPDLRKIYPEIQRVAKARRQKVVAAINTKESGGSRRIFFQELNHNTNLMMLSAGVECEILKAGGGIPPQIGDTVNVHFTAQLIEGNGILPDGADEDMVLVTNRDVCRYWSVALQKIGPGGALKLYVPPPLSEADATRFGIEPDSAMVFEVELLDVKKTSAQDLADAMTPVPPETPIMTQTNYSDAQILRAWGWTAARETHIARLGLDQAEIGALVKGLMAGIKGKSASPDRQSRFSEAEQFVAERQARARTEAEQKQLAANAEFFDQLKKNPKVVRLPDGLCYEILQPGSKGLFPKPGSKGERAVHRTPDQRPNL